MTEPEQLKTLIPQKLDPWGLLRLPGFWRGAAAARHQLSAASATPLEARINVDKLRVIERLAAAAEAGQDVVEMEEFREWLGGGGT